MFPNQNALQKAIRLASPFSGGGALRYGGLS